MSDAPPPDTTLEASDDTWYVYDRHLNLLHVTATLAQAETWAIEHWEIVEIADREELNQDDFWYLLLAAPGRAGYTSRDYQARITRRTRVTAMGWDPDASRRFP